VQGHIPASLDRGSCCRALPRVSKTFKVWGDTRSVVLSVPFHATGLGVLLVMLAAEELLEDLELGGHEGEEIRNDENEWPVCWPHR